MFDVVMMIGFDLVMVGGSVTVESSSGALPSEGPLGLALLDRLSADVDCAAMFWKAAARSGSFIIVVSNERLETRFGFESILWKSCFSSATSPLSDPSSSQSDPSSSSSLSSSSSMALSSSPSSSESSKTSSFRCDLARDSNSS